MAWPDGTNNQYSIAPYMKERQPTAGISVAIDDVIGFPVTGTVVFKWGVADAATVKPTAVMIQQNGGDAPTADHLGTVWVVMNAGMLSGATEYADEAALREATPTWGLETGLLDNGKGWRNSTIIDTPTVGGYGKLAGTSEYFYRTQTSGTTGGWIPVCVAQSAGTAVIDGEDCDLFTASISVSKLRAWYPEGSTDPVPFVGGRRVGLCFGGNSRHDDVWDAMFFLIGQHQDRIFERTELNTRVSGERAIYEDEFLTASQIEAGRGIQIRFRDSEGGVAGQPQYGDPVPEKAHNMIIDTNEYLWALSDTNHFTTIEPDDYLVIKGHGAARFVVEQGSDQAWVDLPLRISTDGIPATGDNTVELDLTSTGGTPPPGHELVVFDVDVETTDWSNYLDSEASPQGPRTKKVIRGYYQPGTTLDVEQNGEEVADEVTKLDFDDEHTPEPGTANVTWEVDETSSGEVRIRGSVAVPEIYKPAIRVQWSKQSVFEAMRYDNEEMICSRIDCKRSQVVSPWGLRQDNLDQYGLVKVISDGPDGFNLVHGPIVNPTSNLNGGALEPERPGRYRVRVGMFGMHNADQLLTTENPQYLHLEQQIHILKYQASGDTWLWHGHLGSFFFDLRPWLKGAPPPDMRELPWAVQGSTMIQLDEGDRFTFFRCARSWPMTYVDHTEPNSTRYFYLRSMNVDVVWHDDGTQTTVNTGPQWPRGIDPQLGPDVENWDFRINGNKITPPRFM